MHLTWVFIHFSPRFGYEKWTLFYGLPQIQIENADKPRNGAFFIQHLLYEFWKEKLRND